MFSDPVLDAAPVARKFAAQYCSHSGADCCDWYHGIWPYFRALGIVATPAHHYDFYTKHLQTAAQRHPALKVLVSGTADYSMPAAVFDACAKTTSLSLHVVDKCRTPLLLTEWYARRIGQIAATTHSDIRQFAPSERFDIICTHSFLGYFDDAARASLIRSYFDLLRPGGSFLTIIRIRPKPVPEVVMFTPDQADAFCERVYREAALAKCGLSPDEMKTAARLYTANFQIHPVTSETALKSLFTHAGFDVAIKVLGEAKAAVKRPPSGPTALGSANYVAVRAVRSSTS